MPIPPSRLVLGSGNLLADRRFDYAEELSERGDHGAAADLFAQAVELAPEWAPGWVALGRSRLRAGLRDEAALALRRAAALDPEDQLGSRLHLAQAEGRSPEAMPPGYVSALFDQYADRFDAHLASLGYCGPAAILAALDETAPRRAYDACLDLGCGTGLMGMALSTYAHAIDGVDLSARMVAKAKARGVYRSVTVADLGDALKRCEPNSYDLVVAADVFVYVGRLDSLFADIGRVLRPTGLLAFTVQELDAPEGYQLGDDMRFGHRRGYLTEALAAHGLQPRVLNTQSARRENGADVPGLVVVASRA